MESNSGQTLLALLTGAAIGAGIGILYAPDKGSKTRSKISKQTKKAKKEIEKQVNQTSSQLSEKAQKARLNFEEKLESTLQSASYKADDILLAMEDKLESLRQQNLKLQKENKVEQAKTKIKKATA